MEALNEEKMRALQGAFARQREQAEISVKETERLSSGTSSGQAEISMGRKRLAYWQGAEDAMSVLLGKQLISLEGKVMDRLVEEVIDSFLMNHEGGKVGE